MLKNKNLLANGIKWLIMLAAYGYLIYKLANVEYWSELKRSFESLNLYRFILLLSIFLLMPLNWGLEALKWQILTKNLATLSFIDAFKSVLAGLNTGFITPSRFGDFIGRVIYIPHKHRLSGILMSFVNGFIQTLVVTVFGLISTYYYSIYFHSSFNFSKYILTASVLLLALVGFYIFFPGIFNRLKEKKWAAKIYDTIKTLSELNYKTFALAILLSSVRFILFCFQYYLMLCFFKIELTPFQAIIGIPTMYLAITYVPTLAASEAAVRASIAVLILGIFSKNEISILLTGILIWLINYILPMLAGSIFVVRKTSADKIRQSI